jgi:hypothetical protein
MNGTSSRAGRAWLAGLALGWFQFVNVPPAAAAAPGVPPGWVGYYQPGGLFVAHPPGWQVRELGDGAFVVLRPGADQVPEALVYVRPRPARAGQEPVAALARLAEEEEAILPGARVLDASPLRPPLRGAMGALSYGAHGRPYRAHALLLEGDRTGALYVMAATEAAWDASAETMARILRGFRYLPAGAEAGGGLPELVTWRDPVENAFTVQVPRGWQVQGGLRRPNTLEYRPEVLLASPDDAIHLRLGDGSLELFTVPYAVPGVGALPPGTRPSAFGGSFLPYLPGHQFLTQYYLPRRFGAAAHLVGTEEHPELAQRYFQLAPPPAGMQGRADSGAVHLELDTPAGRRRGYYAATTKLTAPPPALGGITAWEVLPIDPVGYVCLPELEATARAALAALVRGFAWDLRWYAAQVKVNAAIAAQVRTGVAELNEIRWRTIGQAAAGAERTHLPRELAARGEIQVQDGQTGQVLRVPEAGTQDYFLVHRTGEVVASDRSDLPAFDFRQLARLR